MKAAKVKIILADVDSRKGFDIVNIMQRQYGFDCILCASKDYTFQLPFIYTQKIERLRSATFEAFFEDFQILLDYYKDYTLVYLPISEKPTRFFYQFLKISRPTNLHFMLPNEEFFNMVADKIEFQEFCIYENFPVPRSFTKSDLSDLISNFKPLILKPKSGQGSVGIHYFNTADELKQFQSINFDNYILQEKIISKNQVAGAFYLLREGEVIVSHTHQRLRTFPPEGGVSVFSQSTNNEEILSIGAKLLQKLNWSGVAMIEFMFDETSKEWKIIELNPRLWGSIMLSTFNSSDLLKHYVLLSLGNIEKSVPTTNDSVAIRWIFPFDFLNFIKGSIGFKEFFKLNLSSTCYINFTYSNFYRSVLYLFYFTLNLSSIKRFLKKIS